MNDLEKETIFCRKRFSNWVKEIDPSFHIKDYNKYARLFKNYIETLDVIELMQEWQAGSNWKRDAIHQLVKFHNSRNEI